jgi:hypothetical protein
VVLIGIAQERGTGDGGVLAYLLTAPAGLARVWRADTRHQGGLPDVQRCDPRHQFNRLVGLLQLSHLASVGDQGKVAARELTGQTDAAGLACSRQQCRALRPAPSVRLSDGLIGAMAQPTSTGDRPLFSAQQGVTQGQERLSGQRLGDRQ